MTLEQKPGERRPLSLRCGDAHTIWENVGLQKPPEDPEKERRDMAGILQHNQEASGRDATHPPIGSPTPSGRGRTSLQTSQLFCPWDPLNSLQFSSTCQAFRILGPMNHRLRCRANQGALRHHRAPEKGKGNLKESSGKSEAEGPLPLSWVTELTRSVCAKPPGSGGSWAAHACLLYKRRNYGSQGAPGAGKEKERLFLLRPMSVPEPEKCCWHPRKGPPLARGRGWVAGNSLQGNRVPRWSIAITKFGGRGPARGQQRPRLCFPLRAGYPY